MATAASDLLWRLAEAQYRGDRTVAADTRREIQQVLLDLPPGEGMGNTEYFAYLDARGEVVLKRLHWAPDLAVPEPMDVAPYVPAGEAADYTVPMDEVCGAVLALDEDRLDALDRELREAS